MICAIIVAGGSGSRMQAPVRKQYLDLDGFPIVGHTLLTFDRYPGLDQIILVVPEADREWCRTHIVAPLSLDHDIHLVSGGRRRQESVISGLKAVSTLDGVVMIHDAVRPFVRHALLNACLEGVRRTGACIPAISATDTLKRVDDNGVILGTLDRRTIRLAQTPQTFSIDVIRRAHQLALQRGFIATDDASVAEFSGATVTVIAGDPDNIKITTPQDLFIAHAIIQRRRATNVEPPS